VQSLIGRGGQNRTGQGRAKQDRAEQDSAKPNRAGRAEQDRAGQNRTGQGRAKQDRAGLTCFAIETAVISESPVIIITYKGDERREEGEIKKGESK
jgi:hypothetical protein